MADIQVGTASRAGDGSGTLSELFMRILYTTGAYVFQLRADVYSNIETRPTCFGLRGADKMIRGRRAQWDLLFALDRSALFDEVGEGRIPPIASLRRDGVVIYDSSPKLWDVNIGRHITDEHVQEYIPQTVRAFGIPMAKMTEDEFGPDARDPSKLYQTRNLVALGVAVCMLRIDRDTAEGEIRKRFRNPAVQEANLKAFELGYNYAEAQAWELYDLREIVSGFSVPPEPRQVVMGNHAIAHGALAAECKYDSQYPITPASEIMEELAEEAERAGIVVVQAPDEGEAIQNVLGASIGGSRAMTATSGPGAARMHEGWSEFDAMQQPGVVVHCQRGGPGTGLPTRIGQTDLLDVIFGSHGDKFRVVLAPGDAEEGYYFIQTLFNLTDRYQCLGFLLFDQMIAQSYYTVSKLDPFRIQVDRGKILTAEDIAALKERDPYWQYKRYALTEDGISPRIIPGIPGAGTYINSNEHREEGYSIEERDMRAAMVEKRVRKLYELARTDQDFPEPELLGDPEALLGFISYGAPSSAVTEALEALAAQGTKAKFFRLRTLWPLDRDLPVIREFVRSLKQVYVVEHSTFGQLRHLLQSKLYGEQLPELESLARDDGWLMTSEFVLDAVGGERHA